MDLGSLAAKGVVPARSERAVLHGWRLRFNVQHFFRHEGGVGNIEPTGNSADAVWGVLHECEDAHLPLLDAAEAYGHGYDRIEVPVETRGGVLRATTYVGMASFINAACRPTRRYLNILVKGAEAAGLEPEYVERLRGISLHQPAPAPRFVPPPGEWPVFAADMLTRDPPLTALDGAVFDMSGARPQHDFLRGWFAGRDMTLFHLRRMDSSDGSETWEDVRQGRLSAEQRRYLDAYLQEYSEEYEYVGQCLYQDAGGPTG